MMTSVHLRPPPFVTWADCDGCPSADAPRTQASETTFETSRTFRALSAAGGAGLVGLVCSGLVGGVQTLERKGVEQALRGFDDPSEVRAPRVDLVVVGEPDLGRRGE